MKQLIFLSALFLIPFLMNAQDNNPNGSNPESFGDDAGVIGNQCSFFGARAGDTNTGRDNTYLGFSAGKNIRGNWNTFIGSNAGGETNKFGAGNVFIGASAGVSSGGSYNVFVGNNAGKLNQGGRNTYLGYRAGNDATGSGNVFIGHNAGRYELEDDKLIIDSKTVGTDKHSPLIYGDFAEHYVGIAISTDPADNDIENPNMYGLYVGKGILTEKVKVADIDTDDWSDYVFAEDYELNTIEEVENFIKQNKHLPNVPSAAEVSENGVDMVEMDATLLRQIEELWLHVIEMNKENKQQPSPITEETEDTGTNATELNVNVLNQIEELQSQITELKKHVTELEMQPEQK